MPKVNCLYIPIPNEDDKVKEYHRIVFPEVEQTIAELADIKDPMIATSVGSNSELISHTNKETPFNVISEYMVKSMQTALDHFHLIIHR